MDDRFFEAYPVIVLNDWGLEDKYSPVIYRYCGHLIEVHIDLSAMQGYTRCLASYRQDAVSSWHWFQLVQGTGITYMECPSCGSRTQRVRLKNSLGCAYCVPLLRYKRWQHRWIYQYKRMIRDNNQQAIAATLKSPSNRIKYEIAMEELGLKPRRVSHDAGLSSIKVLQEPILTVASKRSFLHQAQRRVFLSGTMGWWCIERGSDGKLHWNQWEEETRDTDSGGDDDLRPLRSWPGTVLLPLIGPGSDNVGANHRRNYNTRTGLRRDRRRIRALHHIAQANAKQDPSGDT